MPRHLKHTLVRLNGTAAIALLGLIWAEDAEAQVLIWMLLGDKVASDKFHIGFDFGGNLSLLSGLGSQRPAIGPNLALLGEYRFAEHGFLQVEFVATSAMGARHLSPDFFEPPAAVPGVCDRGAVGAATPGSEECHRRGPKASGSPGFAAVVASGRAGGKACPGGPSSRGSAGSGGGRRYFPAGARARVPAPCTFRFSIVTASATRSGPTRNATPLGPAAISPSGRYVNVSRS